MSNINVRLEDISEAIREIKDLPEQKKKRNKIEEFERKLKEDATMLKEHPNIKFEFVDMLTTTVSRIYSDNIDNNDKKKLDAIIEKIFPDEEMRGGKKTKKSMKAKKSKKSKKSKKTRKTKRNIRSKRGTKRKM
jgi:hypothetical protein